MIAATHAVDADLFEWLESDAPRDGCSVVDVAYDGERVGEVRTHLVSRRTYAIAYPRDAKPYSLGEYRSIGEASVALVRAANAHEGLVAALKEIAKLGEFYRSDSSEAGDLADIARAALATAMIEFEARIHRENGFVGKAEPLEGQARLNRAAIAKATAEHPPEND